MSLVLKKVYNSTATILTPTAWDEAGQPTAYSEEVVDARESIHYKEFTDSTGKNTMANKKLYLDKQNVSLGCRIRFSGVDYSVVASRPIFDERNEFYSWAVWVI